MDQMTFTILLATAFLLAVFGWLIRYRRMYGLISGYNMMSAQKKGNVDIERLGRLTGACLFIMAAIMAAGAFLLKLGQGLLGGIVLSLLAPVVIYLMVAGLRSGGNARTAGKTARPGAKLLTGFIALSIVTLVGLIGFMIFRTAQPAAIALEGDALSVSGLYGQKIAIADMQQIALTETLPAIQRRTNGSAVGDRLNGHFTMEGLGAVMLYLDKGRPPFIRIDTASQKIFLNAATPEATRALYDRIRAAKK